VTLRVTDNNSPALTDIDTAEIIVAIPPHPPVADVGGPYTCTAGLPCQLDGAGSFDIDPTDFITSYDWDLDGFPFTYESATGANPDVVFPEVGVFNIGLRVFDNGVLNVNDEPLSDEDFGTVNVEENLPPVADPNGPYSVNEGSIVGLDGTGSSDPNGDPLVHAWDLDGDGEFDDALGATPTFLGVDDGVYPVALRVSDGLLAGTAQSTVTVSNVAPSVALSGGANLDEGDEFTASGSFTDPGTEDTWTGTVDYGDGSGSMWLALSANNTFSLSHVYADNGTYTVSVEITDDDGGSGSASVTVIVDNVPPVVDAGPDTLAENGGAYLGAGSFIDPGTLDTHTATVDYGDGSGIQSLALSTSNTFTLSHVYTAPGTYTVTVTVTDDDGGVGSDTLTVTMDNSNEAPIADPGGPYTVSEGGSVVLSGAGSSDPDGDSITFDWDLDNDQIFETSGVTVTFNASALDDSVVPIKLRVVDPAGASDTAEKTVTVVNVSPAVDAGPDTLIYEGSSFSGAGFFIDPGTLDTWTAMVDYGDGSGPQPLALNPDNSFNLGHVYADDGNYTVTVTVTDDDGGVGSDTMMVAVSNVAPMVDAGDAATIDEGSMLTRSGSFTDPGADTWTATVDYGDGSGPQPLALNTDKTFDLSRNYGNEGSFTVTVTVTDDELASGSDSFVVTVLNVPPTIAADAAAVSIDEAEVGLNSGTFSDVGDDIVTISASTGTVTQVGTQSGTWNWSFESTDGPDESQTVTVTATDDAGDSSSVTFELTVNNVAPAVAPDIAQVIVNESEIAGNTGTFSDPGVDTVTIAASAGNIVETDPLTGRWVWTFASTDGPDESQVIVVTATDSDGAASTTSFELIVNNLPPVAEDDSYSTLEDEELIVAAPGVLGNDTDAGLDTLSATVATGPVNGTVILNADGSFTYTPNANFNGIDGFTYTVQDDDLATDTGTVMIEVYPVNDPPTVSGDPVPYTVQYSDPALITLSGDDIDSTTLSVVTTALPAGLRLGAPNCDAGAPPVDCEWTISGIVEAGPGTYPVTATVTDDGELSDATQLSSAVTFDIVVVQEDARSTYTGPLFLGSDGDGEFALYLRATIQDISLVTDDPATDEYPGDIRNAAVRFLDETGAELCAAPAVELIFSGNEQLGSAECTYEGTLDNNENGRLIGVTVVVENYYVDTSDNEVTVLVVRSGEGKITGGGQIELDNSAGVYAADPDQPTNYGFNAQATQQGKNKYQLKGQVTVIVRATNGRKYMIKSDAILSLGVDLDPDGDGDASVEPHYAEFESRASLRDLTDPRDPISLGDNLILQLRMTDNGEPGKNDTISFTLWDDGKLLFSSNWDGVQSIEQNVKRGNLQVH
jgi:hypothetical protein